MFPISAATLPLVKIADYWSREIEPPASRDELLALLELAWWLGELRGSSWDNRLQLLTKMFEKRGEPELQSVAFVSPNDAGPPTEIPLPDGGIVVRQIVSVPDTAQNWTEASCIDAFEALASLPSQEYFPLFSYSICFIDVTYDEFCSWIGYQGFHAPGFWKPSVANSGKIKTSKDKSAAKKTQEPAEAPRRYSEAEVSRIYAKYRQESKPITDRDDDTAYMKKFGVGREWVRKERRKFPRRKRGERKSAKSAAN